MRAIILAGGYGSRISSLTKNIPKPMIKIGNQPILMHVISTYLKYNINNFHIALGYKGGIIKKYFLSKKFLNYKIIINSKIIHDNKKNNKISISLYDTGLNTMTGGRIKKVIKKIIEKNKVNDDDFLVTYGDGVGNINIDKLIKFHKKKRKIVTITSVRPPARFGELFIKGHKVISFKEKPQMQKGWINGGYFILNKKIINYISGSKTIFERDPLERLVKKNNVVAYKHKSFWQCMDNLRDKKTLDQLSKQKPCPWLK